MWRLLRRRVSTVDADRLIIVAFGDHRLSDLNANTLRCVPQFVWHLSIYHARPSHHSAPFQLYGRRGRLLFLLLRSWVVSLCVSCFRRRSDHMWERLLSDVRTVGVVCRCVRMLVDGVLVADAVRTPRLCCATVVWSLLANGCTLAKVPTAWMRASSCPSYRESVVRQVIERGQVILADVKALAEVEVVSHAETVERGTYDRRVDCLEDPADMVTGLAPLEPSLVQFLPSRQAAIGCIVDSARAGLHTALHRVLEQVRESPLLLLLAVVVGGGGGGWWCGGCTSSCCLDAPHAWRTLYGTFACPTSSTLTAHSPSIDGPTRSPRSCSKQNLLRPDWPAASRSWLPSAPSPPRPPHPPPPPRLVHARATEHLPPPLLLRLVLLLLLSVVVVVVSGKKVQARAPAISVASCTLHQTILPSLATVPQSMLCLVHWLVAGWLAAVAASAAAVSSVVHRGVHVWCCAVWWSLCTAASVKTGLCLEHVHRKRCGCPTHSTPST